MQKVRKVSPVDVVLYVVGKIVLREEVKVP